MKFNLLLTFAFFNLNIFAQGFIRSELTTTLTTPWEMTYGQDGNLWLTESGGRVSKVDPITGVKKIVFTAPDYFSGSILEQSPNCTNPDIGFGTLGLALHPDFLNVATSYIYFVYSYNSTNTVSPVTKFKIVRLKWDAVNDLVINDTTIIPNMPTGYDHLGGRLLAVKQNSINYLYFTIGDNGISETNAPTCYNPTSSNPNFLTQDPNYKNGKIHRFNMNGSVPFDNPISGNSLFTRGHRNPQGLIYNPIQNILYDTEHGDRTDDEINILMSGKNYGWKSVRGYHADNNYTGEAAFVSSYTLTPGITGDGLKEPLYSWCATPQPTTPYNTDWCTVAPTDGVYYNNNWIPNWANSLLVVTLKDGLNTDMEMFRFQLNPDGISLAPSTSLTPNPEKYFSGDQSLNGRLRDIAISPDGKKIYLINNGGTNRDKITVYTYDPLAGIINNSLTESDLKIFPNPANETINISGTQKIKNVKIYSLIGEIMKEEVGELHSINLADLASGLYILSVTTIKNQQVSYKIVKQ